MILSCTTHGSSLLGRAVLRNVQDRLTKRVSWGSPPDDDAAECQKRLTAIVQTAPVDHHRSVSSREVKAVTYHELAICSTPQGYEATLIVDI